MSESCGRPSVSVILNSYNQGLYLQSAIESVLAQDCSLELLITDNGSNDGSAEIARRYQDDPRVRLMLHRENQAVSRRFNEAIDAARGRYVTFLYSDDYFLPDKLRHQLAVFGANPGCGVVYGPAIHENVASGARWERPVIEVRGKGLEALLAPSRHRGPPDMSTPLSLRDCFVDFRFDEGVFAEGEVIFLHIASKYRFHYSPVPTVVLRDHALNAGKAIRRNCAMTRRSLGRLRGYDHLSDGERRELDRFESRLLLSNGWQAARLTPDQAWARRCMRGAVGLDRRLALHPKVAAGALLSLLPAVIRNRVNTLGHWLRGSETEVGYLDDYVGLGSRESSE